MWVRNNTLSAKKGQLRMSGQTSQSDGSGSAWGEAEDLYRQLYKRDNPWSPDWQIEEVVQRQKLRVFSRLDESRRKEVLADLKKQIEQSPERRFADWLSTELRRRNWSQSDLARAIGSYPSVVSKWVNAQQRPRTEQCARIADALEVDIDKVLQVARHRWSEDFIVMDWLVESTVREEIHQILHDIPEVLLVPLIPMLRGLADPEVVATTIARVEETLTVAASPQRSLDARES